MFFCTTVLVTVSRPDAPKMSSLRSSDNGVWVSSVMVTDSRGEAIAPQILAQRVRDLLSEVLAVQVQREEIVLRGHGADGANQLRLQQLLGLAADRVGRRVSLVDANRARGLLDVVFVGSTRM